MKKQSVLKVKSVAGMIAGVLMTFGLSACDGINSDTSARINLVTTQGVSVHKLDQRVEVVAQLSEHKIVLKSGQGDIEIKLPAGLNVSPAHNRVAIAPEVSGQPMKIVIEHELDAPYSPEDTLAGVYSRFSSARSVFTMHLYSSEGQYATSIEIPVSGIVLSSALEALSGDNALADGCTWEILNGRPRCVGRPGASSDRS